MSDQFLQLLDENYDWPAIYPFKFVVPVEQVPILEAMFAEYSQFKNSNSTKKPSRTGKYISMTVEMEMPSSQAVLDLYEKASRIDKLIAI